MFWDQEEKHVTLESKGTWPGSSQSGGLELRVQAPALFFLESELAHATHLCTVLCPPASQLGQSHKGDL